MSLLEWIQCRSVPPAYAKLAVLFVHVVTPGLAAAVKPLSPRLSIETHPSLPPANLPDHP